MEVISTPDAPPANGPYSQGVRDGDRVYVSGQGPLDPETGDPIDGSIDEEAERVFENIAAILEAGGCSFEDVVKVTVYLDDIDDFDAVNDVYAEYLPEPFPARSTIAAGDLPGDIGVEIDVVASV